jgi:hypothetical protein
MPEGKIEIPAYGSKEFRAELLKIMPGYKWTVHGSRNDAVLRATGIQSSGFNRLSTLEVKRIAVGDMKPVYEARSAGYGMRARWLHTHSDGTLARALRGLQDHYEWHSNNFRSHAASLKIGREAPPSSTEER